MNVLSLFDGMSCGQIALKRAGIKYEKYFASEIDKYAITVTQDNYPDTIQLGDVRNVKGIDLPEIDLLIGGIPCQGFSFSGKQLNFEDPRSILFFEYLRILKEVKPKYFLLENVKMKKEYEETISRYLKCTPKLINSSLVSAQNRLRLYWTNIPFKGLPKDKGLVIKDILDTDESNYEYIPREKVVNLTYTKNYLQYDTYGKSNKSQDQRAYYLYGKHGCLDVTCHVKCKILMEDGRVRKTTRLEAERLQTVPEGYTKTVNRRQAMAMLGNGWTVDIISHIFKGLP